MGINQVDPLPGNHAQRTLAAFTADPWDGALPRLRYRAAADSLGWTVLRGNQGPEVDPEALQSAQILLVQRDFVRFSAAFEQVLRHARQRQIPLVMELDDWLPGIPETHPAWEAYVDEGLAMLYAITQADWVVVSTPALAGMLRPWHADVRVWRNTLLPDWLPLREWQPSPPSEPVVLGYMGGGTHAADLEWLAPVIFPLLDHSAGRVRLEIWGGLPPVAYRQHPQVRWHGLDLPDYRAFAHMFGAQPVDIWMAPLVDTPFNRCKSGIKALEYAAAGGAGVYANLPPYQDVVLDGQTGLLASSITEWQTAIQRLIEDGDLRTRLAQGARRQTQDHWLLERRLDEFVSAYQGQPRMRQSGALDVLIEQLYHNHQARRTHAQVVIGALQAQIADQQVHQNNQAAAIQQLGEELQAAQAVLRQTVAEKDQQLFAAQEQIDGLQARLAVIENHWSYRLYRRARNLINRNR